MADDKLIAEHLPLDQSISGAWTIFEQNDTETAIKLADALADKSLYHSQLKAFLSIYKAAITLQPDNVAEAKAAAKQCLKLCTKIRGKKKLKNLLSKKQYTDLELHAEVTYAMVSGMKAMLSFHKCYSIQAFAKIAYTLGQSAKVLNKSRELFEKRTTWESPLSKSTLEAGIRLENGLRQLVVSFLPPQLLKLVSFLGFKGEREKAFKDLNAVAFELPGMYSLLGQYLLILYWLVVEMHGCLGPRPKELEYLETELKKKAQSNPDSLLYKMAFAKLSQIRGNVSGYITVHEGFINSENLLFQLFSNWELAWQYVFIGDFEKAIKCAEAVRTRSLHSPPLVTFFEAIVRFTKGRLDNDQAQLDKCSELIESTQSMKIHFVGNTMTPEKAVQILAKRYFKAGKLFILPLYEQMYNTNFHLLFHSNQDAAGKWLKIIEDEMAVLEKDSEHRERFLAAMFYKGTVLKGLKKYDEANEIFNVILNENKIFKKFKYLVPQSQMELGLILLEQGSNEAAKEHLNTTLKKYSDYITEPAVQIRTYAALRLLGVSTDKSEPIEGVENIEDISNVASEDESDDD